MQVQPYLFLDSRCEEAIGFYRTKPGAEVTRPARVKDAPTASRRRSGPAARTRRCMQPWASPPTTARCRCRWPRLSFPRFGMVADRFDVSWMIYGHPKVPASSAGFAVSWTRRSLSGRWRRASARPGTTNTSTRWFFARPSSVSFAGHRQNLAESLDPYVLGVIRRGNCGKLAADGFGAPRHTSSRFAPTPPRSSVNPARNTVGRVRVPCK